MTEIRSEALADRYQEAAPTPTGVADPRRLRELELENARLRGAVVELTLDNRVLREALRDLGYRPVI